MSRDIVARPELELRQLYVFTVLAEELHFGRAAARLGIAQPPLSQQIQRMEQRVGYPLFERRARGVALTPAGARLLPVARHTIEQVADGLTAARRAGAGELGRLRVGFAASLALTLLPTAIRAHRDRHPGVELDIHEMTTATQVAALLDGAIDVGLLREPPPEPELVTVPILEERLVVALPRRHRLTELRLVPPAALADNDFVMLPRHVAPTVHDRLIGVCHAAGFEPQVVQRAVEWQTVVALVAAGLGVALVPDGVRRLRLSGVAYRQLAGEPALTSVAACWRRDAGTPQIASFVAAIGGEDRGTRRARPRSSPV